MKKVSLIGLGYWGGGPILRTLIELDVLHTICDTDTKLEKKFKKKYPDINYTTNFNDILQNKEIQMVIIALPVQLHYKFAKQALLHDKDVYVEKPMCLKVEHGEELVKLAKEKNKILMVGHLLHYNNCIKKIYELIDKDYIGDIRYITSNRFNLGKIRQNENVTQSLAVHDISVILKLMNQVPEYITCHGQSFITNNIHDISTTIMEFKNGSYVQINVNWLNPFKEQKMVIVGTKGMFVFDDMIEDKLTYYPEYLKWNEGVPIVNKKSKKIINVANEPLPLYNECKHFIECCLTRTQPITDGEEGVRVLRVLDISQKSLIQKKRLKFETQNYFAHETAIIENSEVGDGTKIWHFSHVMDCKIGSNCNIGQNVFIAKGVKIGNGCKIQNNVSIYSGVELGNNVFCGPSCVFTNDKNPRCKFPKNGKYIKTIIEDGVTIGANATIICGITLHKGCFIGAGAVVTKDVSENIVVVGNPAKRLYQVDERGDRII